MNRKPSDPSIPSYATQIRRALLYANFSLARAASVDALIERVRECASWIVDYDRCSMALTEPSQTTYQLECLVEKRAGIPRSRRRNIPLAEGVAGLVIQRRDFVQIDTRKHPDAARVPAADPHLERRVRGILGVPLLTAHGLMGSLLFSSVKHAYDQRDLENAQLFTTQLALNLARLQTLEDLHETHDELVQASERRRLAELFYRDLFDNAPIGYHTMDSSMRITAMNTTEQEMLGYTMQELTGHRWSMLVTPEDRDTFEARWDAMLAGEPIHNLRCTLLRRQGGTLRVMLNVSSLDDPTGNLRAFRGTVLDIHEHSRAFELNSHLAAIVDSSNDAIISMDIHGTILSWNRAAEHIYGYNAKEMVGSNIERTLTPTQRGEAWPAFLADLERGERINDRETQRLHHDGRVLDISLSLSPLRDAQGALIAISTIERDITQRKHVERQLEEATHKLRRSNEELQRFVTFVSHDLRTPLRSLRQLVSLLLEGGREIERPRLLRLLFEQVERMETLTQGLLEYARASNMRTTLARVDLGQMVHEIELLVGPCEGYKIVTHGELPSIVTLWAPLQQVLLNLVSNAIRHHDRDTGLVEIRVEIREHDLLFEVRDDGPGIPKTAQESVFEIFSTLGTLSQSTGIGLAVVRKIVESLGGTITLRSDPGRGSTFRFTWPSSLEQIFEVKQQD